MIRFVFVNVNIENDLTTKELKRLIKGYVSKKYKVRIEGRNAYVDGLQGGSEYNEVMGEWKAL